MSTQHLTRRYRHAALAGAALTLVLTGCQSDSDDRDEGTETPSATATPTETETTTDTSWREAYTEDELRAFDDAVQRVDDYEQSAEPIWREGVATPEAQALFTEYWLVPQVPFGQLQTYQEADVQITGRPTVLDSRATRISLSDSGESVTIDQCVDYSTSRFIQYGAETTGGATEPQIRTVQVDRFVGERETPWQLTEINLYEGEGRPCGG